MNRCCPVCSDEVFAMGPPVPYKEPTTDRIGTLCFCSEDCRDEFEASE